MAVIDNGVNGINARPPSASAVAAARAAAAARNSSAHPGYVPPYQGNESKPTAPYRGGAPTQTAPAVATNKYGVTDTNTLTHPWGVPQPLPVASTGTVNSALTGRAVALSTQTMLKRLGYAVSVDGIIGPETKSALDAQKRGIKPAVWNSQRVGQPGNTGANTAPPGTTPPVTPPGTTPPDTKNTLLDSILARERAALPGDNSGRILALEGMLSRGQVDPTLLAKADAGQTYDPVISALRQNIAQQSAQGPQDQKDIKGWYDALVNNIGERNKNNIAGNEQAINGITSATGGVASALGLDPGTAGGDNIYQTGNIQAAAARGNLASEKSYGADLQGVTAAQGLQALISQRNTDSNKLSDLQAQERAQEGAKGKAIVTSEAGYRQQNLTNKQQYVQSKLGLETAAQAAKQQHFGNEAAIGSQQIAVQNSKNQLTIASDKVAAARTKSEQQYEVAKTTARARIIAATAGLAKARTAQLAAQTKLSEAGSGVFPGLKAKETVNTLFNIQNRIAAIPSLFDKTGKPIPGRTQAIIKAVRTDFVKSGADPRFNLGAKYQAFNMLEALGLKPQKDWYK